MAALSSLRWRCRRGSLELDLLLERYLERHDGGATEEERAAFLKLLDLEDPELMDYLMGSRRAGDPETANLVEKIRAISLSDA